MKKLILIFLMYGVTNLNCSDNNNNNYNIRKIKNSLCWLTASCLLYGAGLSCVANGAYNGARLMQCDPTCSTNDCSSLETSTLCNLIFGVLFAITGITFDCLGQEGWKQAHKILDDQKKRQEEPPV